MLPADVTRTYSRFSTASATPTRAASPSDGLTPSTNWPAGSTTISGAGFDAWRTNGRSVRRASITGCPLDCHPISSDGESRSPAWSGRCARARTSPSTDCRESGRQPWRLRSSINQASAATSATGCSGRASDPAQTPPARSTAGHRHSSALVSQPATSPGCRISRTALRRSATQSAHGECCS